jgi:ABC-type glycerol-3-phosphate transport system permease component
MLLPLYYIIVSAFKPLDELVVFPPRFYVRRPTIGSFITLNQVVQNFWVPISRYAFNSIFVSVVATVGSMILGSLAAYPMAKHDYVGKKFIDGLIILSLLFTASVTALPQYIVMSSLRMIDTYWALFLPTWQFTLGLYLMKQFMTMLPVEMLEAARIDGANEWRVYANVVMPIIKPAWLTVIVLSFQSIWNSSGIVVYRESLKVLPSLTAQIAGGGLPRMGAGLAFSLLMLIPPIIIFLLAQNSIIETMTTSGIKG